MKKLRLGSLHWVGSLRIERLPIVLRDRRPEQRFEIHVRKGEHVPGSMGLETQ